MAFWSILENLVDLHFNAAIKAFIAPSVSDIEESNMHVIISGPHLMIAADIKCQTSFVFSRTKDRFHFPAWGRLQHFQFCCRYCLTLNFPATSPLLMLSGEIKYVSSKKIWLLLMKTKSVHRNQDDRSFELFLMLKIWCPGSEGQQSQQASPDTSSSSAPGKTRSFSQKRGEISAGCPGAAPSSLLMAILPRRPDANLNQLHSELSASAQPTLLHHPALVIT